MADSYVCSGATMKCTMGTSTAKLTVLPIRTVFLTGQPMANISDHLTMVNLAPFGRCRSLGFPATAAATAAHHGHLTPMPCMHNTPFPWMGGKMDYIVKGDPALLKSCTCQCMWGGTISLITDGQTPTGSADLSKLPQEQFQSYQQTDNDTPKEGKITEKFNKAGEYRAQGMGLLASFKKANHDVNFKNSRNKEKFMSDDDADLSKSNKNYGKNEQYGINCATTTTAFMLRKQGYDVTARARNANEHTDSIAYGLNIYKAWKNPDGSDVSPTMLLSQFNDKVSAKGLEDELNTLNDTKAEILRIQNILRSDSNLSDDDIRALNARKDTLMDSYYDSREALAPVYKEMLMEACEEEGYYTFGLVWDAVSIGGGHYTVIKSEKDKDGNTILTNIEPQTGEPFESIDDMVDALDYPPDVDDTIMRTDNKEFNEEYNDLFDIN